MSPLWYRVEEFEAVVVVDDICGTELEQIVVLRVFGLGGLCINLVFVSS